MANTVNDVMNVIASPDYGIKNIAGTTQEILAILQGTHNSQNNIHAIANEVKSLLQELVTVSTEKKPVEVGGNFAKVNNKNIQNILDETKGIRKAIDNLTKSLAKQGGGTPAIAKLSDKASERVADAMTKNIEKQNKGGAISALVDAFSKLKNISIKDLLIGNKKVKSIMKMFKNAKEELKVDEKDLNSIIKLINASPEMVKIISKIGKKVDRINKKEIIKKLSDILVGETSILSIARSLQENEKVFNKAGKVSKSIKELASSLNKTMRKLFFASLWAKVANNGVQSIEKVLDKLIPLATKLSKNEKNIKQGAKAARKLTTLVGNLLITSIFLTITAVVGIPAILGAMVLGVIVNKLIPVAKKLSKNNKHIGKSIISAIGLAAFTGIMLVTTLMLALVAKNGILALLGSLVVLGVVTINIFTFKMLSKAKKQVIQGAILMAIMSLSLLIFGIALGKITSATKGVTFKQVAIIATTIILLGLAVAAMGIPAVFPFIALGSIAMLLMGIALIPFGIALKKIAEATKTLKMKHILLVTGAMVTLAAGISAMAVFMIPVLLGSITLGLMVPPLFMFVKSLDILSKMKTIPTKQLNQALSAMKTVGNFFKRNKLSIKAVLNAWKYRMVLGPFASAVDKLGKLKEMGVIPMKLVHGALNAIKTVGNFFKNNKLSFKAIWNAKKYKWVLNPFSNAVDKLGKLKEIGVIPMKLVHGALRAIKAVGNFFKNNKLSFKAIWNAKKYKWVLNPFYSAVDKLGKLKEMGVIPMKLVYGALNAISTIGNYYSKNPIPWKAIKASYRYKWILRPFGSAIGYLGKLKEMGTIPMKLVYGALRAISAISDFYQGQDLGFFDGISAMISANMITGIVKSFGKAVGAFKDLKELRNVPTDAINSILNSISGIVWYYRHVKFGKHIKFKSILTRYVVRRFAEMAIDIQDKLGNIKAVDYDAIKSIILSCRRIIDYYTYTKFFLRRKKVLNMNECVKLFTLSVQDLQSIEFDKTKYGSIKIAVKSMRKIMRFLKYGTLNPIQRIRARKNLSMLSAVASVVSKLSSINTSNMLSIGDVLSNTLSGVKTVDMGQVIAVTNMFNAFGRISKSENVINKFTESVKEFTETCKDLMDAMSNNTNAINNMDTSGSKKSGSIFDNIKERVGNFIGGGSNDNNTTIQTNSVRIANVDELAKTIADKINGALSVDVADTQIQLLINGTGGNEWTITKY